MLQIYSGIMNSIIGNLFGPIVGFISKLISSLIGHAELQDTNIGGGDGASRYEPEPGDEGCGNCSRCVAARRQRLEEKCALVENYITDNLALYEKLDKILQLQTLNITRQLVLLKNLNSSSEHLKAAISDCLEKHTFCVSQFTQGMERLQINHKVEENVAIVRFEQNTADFKRNLIGNIVKNEKRSLTELLQ